MTTGNIASPGNCAPMNCPQEAIGIRQLFRTFFNDKLSSIVQNWETKRQQRIDRDAFLHLLKLDERELKDIGLTRDDVIQASKMPLSYNAALELENRKNKTR